MSSSVRKIFTVLIVVVACVLIGAFVLNMLLPNVTKTLINAVEDMIFKATGMSFDFNADGTSGTGGNNTYTGDESGEDAGGAGTVEGFN